MDRKKKQVRKAIELVKKYCPGGHVRLGAPRAPSAGTLLRGMEGGPLRRSPESMGCIEQSASVFLQTRNLLSVSAMTPSFSFDSASRAFVRATPWFISPIPASVFVIFSFVFIICPLDSTIF